MSSFSIVPQFEFVRLFADKTETQTNVEIIIHCIIW